MAGLIQKQMMDPSAGDEANEKEPVEGTGPDGSPQHEGMEGEKPEPSEMGAQQPAGGAEANEKGGEPDVNNPAFVQATHLAMEALYGQGAAKDIAKQLNSTKDHVQALSDVSYDITSIIDERTKGQVPDEMITMLAVKILSEVADIAEASGISVTSQDVAGAFKDMLLRFLGENGVDTTQLQQSMDQIDPKVFEQAQQGA